MDGGSTVFMSEQLQCLTIFTGQFLSLCSTGISSVAIPAFCHLHSVFPSTSKTSDHVLPIIFLQAVENSSTDLSRLVFSKQGPAHPSPPCHMLQTPDHLSSSPHWNLFSWWGPRTGDSDWMQLQRSWAEANNSFPCPAQCVVSPGCSKGALLTLEPPTPRKLLLLPPSEGLQKLPSAAFSPGLTWSVCRVTLLQLPESTSAFKTLWELHLAFYLQM